MDVKPAAASTSEQFQVDEVSPSYWRATFTNGPVNLFDSDTIEQLAALIDRIEAAIELTVVVSAATTPITTRSGC
jgi:hypothetical protein